MGYSLKTRCLVLAGWVAAVSPLWCCCIAWGGSAEHASGQYASASAELDDCTGCPASGEDRPAEGQSSQPDDPCQCEQYRLDIDPSGSGHVTSLAVVLPVQPVLIQSPETGLIVVGGQASYISTSRRDPLGGETQSLFALSCLLLV
jgi:hypothetical protein